MLRFTINRLIQSVIVVFAVFTITFFMIRLAPGDPFAGEKAMPEDVRRVMESRYGMQSASEYQGLKGFEYVKVRASGLTSEYFYTLRRFATGDFMPSFKYQGMWNAKIIADAFPISLTIGLAALAVALALGLPAGIIAAVRASSPHR